jgi:hypothetical protein
MTKELRKKIMWLAFSHTAVFTIGIMAGRAWS